MGVAVHFSVLVQYSLLRSHPVKVLPKVLGDEVFEVRHRLEKLHLVVVILDLVGHCLLHGGLATEQLLVLLGDEESELLDFLVGHAVYLLPRQLVKALLEPIQSVSLCGCLLDKV